MMEDGRVEKAIWALDARGRLPRVGMPLQMTRKRGRGRPPGIAPERHEVLARLVREGLSLGQIAERLGVSRQCIHVQLRKCPELEALRRRVKAALEVHRKVARQERAGWAGLLSRQRGGKSIVRFLIEARKRGWNVEVRPRRRPRVNGVPVAFHHPQKVRQASNGPNSKARYYHARITRPEWLHVVSLPSGGYLIFPPGSIRKPGSIYIPVSRPFAESRWPAWPQPIAATQTAA